MKHFCSLLFLMTGLIALLECRTQTRISSARPGKRFLSDIDDNRLRKAKNTPDDWLTYGGSYAEDRFSSLRQINKETVSRLGLAWSLNLGTSRGIEATPLVADGMMYLTGPWSKVYAIDVRTGKLSWMYDPKVSGTYGEKACCDVVNRGVALYKGRVYVGTLDGRLISLEAATGKLLWETLTVDTTKAYTITGAPRIVDGKVIIGNGGADYGVRGYITAYDALTGRQRWRFFTVPGDPAQPAESEAMATAAKTWRGSWWKYGGGGTVWDAMAYDPELKLLYIGTGNGSPWNREHRSPGGGDNLFVSSILAINPDTGKLVWYYQTTPGESWDYTATQHLILAELPLNGQTRKVIMQAPKNGFFYVLDRTNGKFISAKPYTYVNWASGIDSLTGRPIESDFSRYTQHNAVLYPGPLGGHNWQPMAFNPETKLVYIPVHDLPSQYGQNPAWAFNQVSSFGSGSGWNTAIGYDSTKPARPEPGAAKLAYVGKLVAWDPMRQREAWRVTHPAPFNGGVLTTAGGLVFQGTATGKLVVYDAANGQVLWQKDLGTGILAPPVTYQVDGKQYVSIAVGWGSVVGLGTKFTSSLHPGTVYTFSLDASQPMPSFPTFAARKLINRPFQASAQEIKHGRTLYGQYCSHCHGSVASGGGALPDLGFSSTGVHQNFEKIVREGLLVTNGMPNFGKRLDAQAVQDIHNYILSTAQEQLAKQAK